MRTSLDDRTRDRALPAPATETATAAAPIPGAPRRPREARQPVHTVYGGAHLFRADTAVKLGKLALRSLDAHAGDAFSFARAIGLSGADALPTGDAAGDAASAVIDRLERDEASARVEHPEAWLAKTVYERTRAKLEREPVEDFRIDFEDGYGHRGDAAEDEAAESAARAVAEGLDAGSLPPFIGIRIKAFDAHTGRRGARTLDGFLTTLLDATEGRLPPGFVVTLPKVTRTGEVAALASLLDAIESRFGLETGSIQAELMVETTESLIGADGSVALRHLVAAGDGRVVGAHFGVYDYTAELGLAAEEQRIDHPACDQARDLMQIALARTGVHLSDGATNVMPVAATADDGGLDSALARRREIHAGWRLHFGHVRRSLARGFYQGWDLHPAQLPTRYAAVTSFFLEGLDAATRRLRAFVEQAAQATLLGEVFDDAATGQGLLNVFRRGLACGAVTEDEARATGLERHELESRSFRAIVEARAGH